MDIFSNPLSKDQVQLSNRRVTIIMPIQRLAGDFMKDYIFLSVGRVGAAYKDVTQPCYYLQIMNIETIVFSLILVFLTAISPLQLED